MLACAPRSRTAAKTISADDLFFCNGSNPDTRQTIGREPVAVAGDQVNGSTVDGRNEHDPAVHGRDGTVVEDDIALDERVDVGGDCC